MNPCSACSSGFASPRLPPRSAAWTKAATLPCACCARPDSARSRKFPLTGSPASLPRSMPARGAKGVIECELVSSGEKWGRGPRKDVHSSTKAMLDSPAWHLVEALVTLVSPDGNTPAIEGFADKARPLSAEEKKMIAEAARRLDENVAKKQLSVEHWVHDVNYEQALELLQSRPTVNIEGLVGGYTGPGGKTILPHRAVAKLDLRLVPDMKADEALAALKAHLAKYGFGDIEVK